MRTVAALLSLTLSACNISSNTPTVQPSSSIRTVDLATAPAHAATAHGFVVRLKQRVHRPATANLTFETTMRAIGATHVQPLLKGRPNQRFEDVLTFRTGAPQQEVLAAFKHLDAVEWVAADHSAWALTNDTLRDRQWNLDTLAVDHAWAHNDGSGVIVAIVDTGVSVGPDGFGNLTKGYDFIDSDKDPSDENGHGTHVASTLAAATNNDMGIAGFAPGVSIMPVRVLAADGYGTNSSVSAGVIWAVDHGADVINMSLGSWFADPSLQEACDYAREQGVTVVAAAGNDGFDQLNFPARFDSVISVGATDLDNQRAWYSNAGSAVDIMAPGGDVDMDLDQDGFPDGILAETFDKFGWDYLLYNGTSMASPHVAATAALLVAQGYDDPEAIRFQLTASATDIGAPGHDKDHGFGLLNAVGALSSDLNACGDAHICADDLLAGDLQITEIMPNPSVCGDGKAEWIEIFNHTPLRINASGLILEDADGLRGTIQQLIIAPRAHVVVGRSSDTNWCDPDLTPDAFWGSTPRLTNMGDQLSLVTPSGVYVDQTIPYDHSKVFPGESIELNGDAYLDTDDASSDDRLWKPATVAYGAHLGTPGESNASPPLSASDLRYGDLVITEVMANPTAGPDRTGEWFEVHNNSGMVINVTGLIIEDAAGHRVVSDGYWSHWFRLWPDTRYVIAAGTVDSFVGPERPDSFYGSTMRINNEGDALRLLSEGDEVLIDEVKLGRARKGKSVEYTGTIDADSNNAPGKWEVSTRQYLDGHYGTPAW
jgi:subtilisin family serine protease